MHQFETVVGTVRIRNLAFERRKGADLIDGKFVHLEVLWRIDDDDNRYPGEWVLAPVDLVTRSLFDAADIVWIASGDFQEDSIQ